MLRLVYTLASIAKAMPWCKSARNEARNTSPQQPFRLHKMDETANLLTNPTKATSWPACKRHTYWSIEQRVKRKGKEAEELGAKLWFRWNQNDWKICEEVDVFGLMVGSGVDSQKTRWMSADNPQENERSMRCAYVKRYWDTRSYVMRYAGGFSKWCENRWWILGHQNTFHVKLRKMTWG